MTPAQWFRYGGCPTCEADTGNPCTFRRWGLGSYLEAPHPARPLSASTEDISRLLDDVVETTVREGVSVHPGDTLILRIDPEAWSQQQFEDLAGEIEAIRAHIEARLPRNAKVVVIAAAGQLGVIRGEEAAETAPGATAGVEGGQIGGRGGVS